MPATWKGTIGFGLVAIPVALHTAVREHDVALHQVHRKDGGRIRMQRFCELEGTKVEYSEVAKGTEAEDGSMVVLEKEDLEKLPLPSVDRVEVLRFIPLEQIDVVAFDKPYYVEPLTHGGPAYALLRDAMNETGRVGMCKVALRTREALAVLRPHGDYLVLETIHWPDEIKEPAFKGLRDLPEPRPQEVSMAVSLIESLAGDFDPTAERDTYADALRELVNAKAKGAAPPERANAPAAENVTDLLSALRASVEASRKTERPKKKATAKKRKSA
jgi:DNA end-binding protein Ku